MKTITFGMFTTAKMREKKIEELELSARSENGLKRAKIFTIGDVIDKWDGLYTIRNLGAKSVSEVKSALFNYNIQNLDDDDMKEFIKMFEVA